LKEKPTAITEYPETEQGEDKFTKQRENSGKKPDVTEVLKQPPRVAPRKKRTIGSPMRHVKF
jgi:hypothetical protein